MEIIRIRYDEEDGTLVRLGIVTPKGSRVVMHSDGFVAVKIAGGSYTSGQNQRGYGPARFVVYQEVYDDDERERYNEDGGQHWLANGDVNGWINVQEVLSWPVRS